MSSTSTSPSISLSLSLLLSLLVLLLLVSLPSPAASVPIKDPKPGPGFAFSGAGARIPQLYALFETLVKGEYPGKTPIRPSVVSGSSSGSIIAVLASAVLETIDGGIPNGKNFTWDEATQLFFEMKTNWIVDDSAGGIAKIPYNLYEGYLLDNTPEYNTLLNLFSQRNYNTLGDLYLPTIICTLDQATGMEVHLDSLNPAHKDIPLLDAIMASTAIPGVFKPRKITSLDSIYVDGGTGVDQIPTNPLLTHSLVTEVYALAYSGSVKDSGNRIAPWLRSIKIIYNLLAAFEDTRVQMSICGLDSVAREARIPAYQYIPDLAKSYPGLDFDYGKAQYDATRAWAMATDPLLLNPKMVVN